jgi:bile acid-coenzyme A ligase
MTEEMGGPSLHLTARSPALEIVDVDRTSIAVTWSEFERVVRRFSARLWAAEPAPDLVLVRARQDVESVAAVMACFRLGICVFPIDPSDAVLDRYGIRPLLGPYGLVYIIDGADVSFLQGRPSHGPTGTRPSFLMLSGGTTGKPRVIALAMGPAGRPSLLLQHMNWRPSATQLVVGPIWHAAPFSTLVRGLMAGCSTLLLASFTPQLVLELIDSRRAQWVQMAGIHMKWTIEQLSAEATAPPDLLAVVHTSGPTSPKTKESWIRFVGAERLFEYYGGTEGIGVTMIRGDDWRRHPGSVGRGLFTQLQVRDEDGGILPAGRSGMVWMRSSTTRDDSGRNRFRSLGDYGHLDVDGYLFLDPRRHDMFLVGDVNVYPAEIEDVIMSDDRVGDVAVVARPHPVLGAAPSALVVRRDPKLSRQMVIDWCRERLPQPKVPNDVEFVDALPRGENGKLNRRGLNISWNGAERERD